MDKINYTIRGFAEIAYQSVVVGIPPPDFVLNIMYLAALGRFVFNVNNNKLGFQFNSSAPITPIIAYAGGGGVIVPTIFGGANANPVWLISNIKIEFLTLQGFSNEARISNYFSMVEFPFVDW